MSFFWVCSPPIPLCLLFHTRYQFYHKANFFQQIGDLLEQGQSIFGYLVNIALENSTNLWKNDICYTLILCQTIPTYANYAKLYLQSVFLLSAKQCKKCEILYGIFAQIFFKCEIGVFDKWIFKVVFQFPAPQCFFWDCFITCGKLRCLAWCLFFWRSL